MLVKLGLRVLPNLKLEKLVRQGNKYLGEDLTIFIPPRLLK